jgi:hypothetical protein
MRWWRGSRRIKARRSRPLEFSNAAKNNSETLKLGWALPMSRSVVVYLATKGRELGSAAASVEVPCYFLVTSFLIRSPDSFPQTRSYGWRW